MNVKNNKLRQRSKQIFEQVFLELLQTKEISQISVSLICKKAELNRSTFYSNYIDIYDLADSIRKNLVKYVEELYDNDITNNVGENYLKLFQHIKENQLFYKAYFKLGYENSYEINVADIIKQKKIFVDDDINYHIVFHRAGLNAIIKQWLFNGCKESPEKMEEIIKDEYSGRNNPI